MILDVPLILRVVIATVLILVLAVAPALAIFAGLWGLRHPNSRWRW